MNGCSSFYVATHPQWHSLRSVTAGRGSSRLCNLECRKRGLKMDEVCFILFNIQCSFEGCQLSIHSFIIISLDSPKLHTENVSGTHYLKL